MDDEAVAEGLLSIVKDLREASRQENWIVLSGHTLNTQHGNGWFSPDLWKQVSLVS
jgi:hypothetical protein